MFTPDAYSDDLRPNASCTDCGADYSKADHDPTTTCDACSDRRDAHTSRLERRLRMATARPPVPVLTPAEIALSVALLGCGYTLQQTIDRIQVNRAKRPLSGSEVA